MQTSRPDIRPRMDWAGAVLAAAGLFLIVFGFSHAETASWSAPLTIGSLAGGVIALAAFAFAESRVSHPLLPLRVVLDRARGGSYISVGLSGIAIFGVFLFLTYYLQTIKHYSPVTSGLAFLPMIACILLASNISSIVLLPRASCVASSSPRLRDRQASIDSAIRMHYNECVLKKVRDSDWSADHIATHDVTLDEVREAILEHPYWSVPGRDGTSLIYGRTYAGRYLFVVAIAEGEEAFIITARDMTDAEKRTFHRKAR
jgi:hypothetical protein